MKTLTYTTKIRLSKAVFFVLVLAMLSMQWSKAHIHLAEHHDHGGSHHQHSISVHTHPSFTQNDNVVDPVHQIDEHEANVVVLDNHCNLHKWNSLDDQPLALTFVTYQLNLTTSSVIVDTPKFSTSNRRYIDYSTLQLRAPPELS